MLYVVCFFFFKQKTAYEMRISDWSSDVCSSDLTGPDQRPCHWQGAPDRAWHRHSPERRPCWPSALPLRCGPDRKREWIESYPGSRKRLAHHLKPHTKAFEAYGPTPEDRKSVVKGKSVSVSVDPGGRRIIKKKQT